MPTIQPSAISVVATQLAQTDRRTLSQAWFDALHLAHETAPLRSRVPSHESVTHEPAYASHEAHATPTLTAQRHADMRVAVRSDERTLPIERERRSQRSELARRIERAIVRRTPAPLASLAIRADAGRVHLLVRSEGGRTRIVALCLPAQRGAVEAALAQARFALARRGIVLDADVRSAA